MAEWTEEITHVAGTDLAVIKGGQGKPLLILHEELGHPGWLELAPGVGERAHAASFQFSPASASRPASSKSAISMSWACSIHGSCAR